MVIIEIRLGLHWKQIPDPAGIQPAEAAEYHMHRYQHDYNLQTNTFDLPLKVGPLLQSTEHV